jgi:hypothetical protein
VGIEGAARGRRQLLRYEQRGEFGSYPGELGTGVVEGLGDRAPTGPAGQDTLLFRGGGAAFLLDAAEGFQGGEVGADTGYRTGRG